MGISEGVLSGIFATLENQQTNDMNQGQTTPKHGERKMTTRRSKIAAKVKSGGANWKKEVADELGLDPTHLRRLADSGSISAEGINYLDVAKYLYNRATEALNEGEDATAAELDEKIGEFWEKLTSDEMSEFNAYADEQEAMDDEDVLMLSLEDAMDMFEDGEDVDLDLLSHDDKKEFIKWRKELGLIPQGVNPPDARENHGAGPDVHVNDDGEHVTELEAAGLSDKLCEELDQLFQVRTFADAALLTASQVKGIKGVGKKKLEALDEELSKRGLSFAEEATVSMVTELSRDEKRAREENGPAKIAKGLAAPSKKAKSNSTPPTLYVDCKPTFRSVTKLSSVVRDVNKAVSELNGVADFRQVPNGIDEVVATIAGMVEDGELDGQSLYLNSRMPVQSQLLEAIAPMCGDMYIASCM